MKRPALSLKGRALAWLAQREHSRSELRQKLLRYVSRQAVPGEEAPDAAGVVEPLLDWLEAHRYLSEERFVESRIHVRAARYGNLRIRQELAQHGVMLDDSSAQQLNESEFARASEVWRRKFGGEVAVDAAQRARQMRFLSARGFSPEVVRRVIRGTPD